MEEAQLQQGEGGTTPQDAAPPELAPTGPALATPVRWQLYYWPKMAGRGDFIRLMFAFKNIEYDDVANVEQNSSSVLRFYKGEADGFPVFAPPIIKKGDFVLSSTPVILEYLGKEFDMLPQDTMDAAHAMQVCVAVGCIVIRICGSCMGIQWGWVAKHFLLYYLPYGRLFPKSFRWLPMHFTVT